MKKHTGADRALKVNSRLLIVSSAVILIVAGYLLWWSHQYSDASELVVDQPGCGEMVKARPYTFSLNQDSKLAEMIGKGEPVLVCAGTLSYQDEGDNAQFIISTNESKAALLSQSLFIGLGFLPLEGSRPIRVNEPAPTYENGSVVTAYLPETFITENKGKSLSVRFNSKGSGSDDQLLQAETELAKGSLEL